MQNKDNIVRIYRDCESNVAPCIDGKKTCERWAQYQTERLPVEVLGRWVSGRFLDKSGREWRHQGPVQWAVLTGAKPWSSIPGVVVLDADDADAIRLVRTRCPATPMMTSTPSGGMHFFYKHPGGRVKQALKMEWQGRTYNLDRKADGNYVMTPGTVSPKSGRSYGWNAPWTPELLHRLPTFDPNWIPVRERDVEEVVVDRKLVERTLAAVQEKVAGPARRAMAERWLERQPGATQGDNADGHAYALAVRLVWGFGLDHEDAVELLSAWGQRPDQRDKDGAWYPWRWAECHHKVTDAARADYTLPGNLLVAEVGLWQQEQLEKTIGHGYAVADSDKH